MSEASSDHSREGLVERIEQIQRRREELHGRLERGEVGDHELPDFRGGWNAWCKEALELRAEARAAGMGDRWHEATRL